MTDDLSAIEQLAGALLLKVGAGERRRLLRQIARDLRKSQGDRIARQQDPDGTTYPRRKAKEPARPGNYAVRFLYPKGAAEPRAVFMKSWVREGPLLTGYDIEAGGIRSFFWDDVAKWLPVEEGDRNKGGGKFRRKGSIRQKAMFRKLRNGRNLRADATDQEAWVGFSGRAAQVARVHQEGLSDRPSVKAQPVRYARRTLLGLTDSERQRILDLVLAHVTA